MAKNIGLAGSEFFYTSNDCTVPRGRVAAFSKSFHVNDIRANSSIKRIINNAILWSLVSKNKTVGFFSTDNTTFDETFIELLTDSGFTSQEVSLLPPWYYEYQDLSSFNYGCYVLFPSYNAQLGQQMKDSMQRHIMNEVLQRRKGLVIGEWFHFLQSLPLDTKRSFSFHGDGSVANQGEDPSDGLHTISPFAFSDFINLSKPISSLFIKSLEYNDSINSSLPTSFNISNIISFSPVIYNSAGYSAIFSDLSELKENTESKNGEYSRINKIYYYIDTGDEIEQTTTTTTTAAPISPNIKFHVATIQEQDVCGPYKLSLVGKHANLFSLEDGNIYLLKNPEFSEEYKIRLRYEDLFIPKRFPDVLKDLSFVLRECDSPLSKPISGAKEVWGFRDDNIWGKPVGSFNPTDYYFAGEGTLENPLNVELGGGHNENIVMWIQVNERGPLSYTISSDTEAAHDPISSPYCNSTNVTLRSNSDWANLYIVSGVDLQPMQHSETIALLQENGYDDLNETQLESVDVAGLGVAGVTTVRNNEEKYIDFNPESDNNVYLLFTFSKDSTISIGEDRVKATLLIGETTPPPPVIGEFSITLFNRIEQSRVSVGNENGTSITVTYTRLVGEDVVDSNDNDLDIVLTVPQGYRIAEDPIYTIIPSDSPISIDIDSNNPLRARIRNFTMPLSGSATIYIDGLLEPLPTTTLPPRQTYSLVFKNFASNTRFSYDGLLIPENSSDETYIFNYVQTEGTGSTKNINGCFAKYLTYVASEDGFTFYENEKAPIVSITNENFDFNTATHISCLPDDRISEGIGQVTYTYCDESGYNGYEIDIEGGIRVNFGKQCSNTFDPLPIRIDLPDMPVGGGVVYIRLDGVPSEITTTPPPPTTPEPPTTAPPCDDLILVFCSQDLVCNPDGDGCVPDLNASTNTLLFESCCQNLSNEDLIRIAYITKLESEPDNLTTEEQLDALRVVYSGSCPSTPSVAFTNCKPQSSNGTCINTIGIEAIDAFPCNPLP